MRTWALTRAELGRAATNRVYWGVAAAGVALVVVSVLMGSTQPVNGVGAGLTSAQQASQALAINAYAITLFTAIIGILIVTRDFGSRMMSRILRVAPGETPVLAAKAVTAAVFCRVVGLLAATATLAVVWWSLHRSGQTMDLGLSPVLFVLRHALNASLSGLWGVFLGFVLRSSTLAIVVQAVYVFLLESTLISSFPAIGRWLVGGAGSAIVDDPTVPSRFSLPQGLGLYLGWLIVLAVVAAVLLHSQRGSYRSRPQRFTSAHAGA
jgi:hypothetical protein